MFHLYILSLFVAPNCLYRCFLLLVLLVLVVIRVTVKFVK